MRIAVFTDAWSPQVNGVVTHLRETLPLLAHSHDVHLFTFRSQDMDLPESIKTYTVGSIPSRVYPEVRVTNPFSTVCSRAVMDIKPDIIHVHTPGTVGASGVMLAQRFHIPLVMTFHTYLADPEYLRTIGFTWFGLYKSSLLQGAIWGWMGWFYNKADIIISPSQTTQDDIKQHFGALLTYKVISPGVVLEKFHKPDMTEKEMCDTYGLKQRYFLYAGRLSKEKNIDELIHAFFDSKVWQDYEPVSLVIVGSGPQEKALRREASRLAIEHHVIFTGLIPHRKLQSSGMYNRAIAFVSMSTSETYGLTFVEAMAAGTPLIVVRAKAAAEIFDNNGKLCSPHDITGFGGAMSMLAHDHELKAKMGTQSLHIAEKHSVKECVNKLEEVYKSLSPQQEHLH